MLQALKNMFTSGTVQKQFSISGSNQSILANGLSNVSTLSGVGGLSFSKQTPTTINGIPVFSISFNQSIINLYSTYLNHTTQGNTGSGADTMYLNTSYQPIAYQYYQGDYCETITPGSYPTTAIIGQSGYLANYTCWTNKSKNSVDYSIIQTYETSSDSKGNMIFKIINNTYWTGPINTNTFTNQDTLSFNISSSGVATIYGWSTSSIVSQYSCATHPGITCNISEISFN